MKTLGEILKLSTSFLEEKKIDRPRFSAEILLAHALKMKRVELYMQFDRPLIDSEVAPFREFIRRRASGEPIEYVLGTIDFYGCAIEVDSRVLIPRQETEILADHIVKRLKGKALWDVCTGSGCLGISLKKTEPSLDVTLSDISKEALDLARKNGARNGVELKYLLGDLLEPFKGLSADIIVCNPPYISQSEYLNLDPSVSRFEPKLALVGGERGTEVYERLAAVLPGHLNPGGLVFLEIGAGQGVDVKKIFSEGPWAQKELLADWAGKDRFFFLEKQSNSRVS
ncbi:MAG: protein-(glutamine-N5) methyltransferase, release factor-specific [Chlamydiae bacterium RIFCSPHIGHO2_12_FULL_49_9]|nr:MAG: protein-(glutamine-N5) methyltransferase, release factor-specific [Chlamydiae bacterium RIFCSPHIGHO2_12_FULL_49_9]